MELERLVDTLFGHAAPYLELRDDMLHTRVAFYYAQMLLNCEGGSPNIIFPAIILHDIGWSKVDKDKINSAYGMNKKEPFANALNRKHEIEGAKIAVHVLESIGYDSFCIKEIARIIEKHDSGKEAKTIEEKIVKDADKLWRFSKKGFYFELKRQGTAPEARLKFLARHLNNWFFTERAMRIAQIELKARANESNLT